jgi:Primase C terminal 1 (PriCT-1)
MRRSALLDVQKTRGIEQPAPVGDAATIGRRNDSVFRLALALAHAAESQADLLAQARKANAELCTPPNDDAEVVRTVRKVWEYKLADRLMAPGSESAIILPAATIGRLLAAGETDAMALLALLQKAHGGRRKTFAASPEAMQRERLIGSWDKRRYRHAARKLCDLGELVQVHEGGKGARDPALYRFAEGGRFAPQY